MRLIAQSTLDNAVLLKLFMHAQESDKRLSAGELSEQFGFPVSPKRTELALEHLEGREFVHRYSNGNTTITSKGYAEVERQLQDSESALSEYALQGDVWLSEQTFEIGGIPASNRIVSRKDNQQNLDTIQGGLKELEEALNIDNEIGAALGDEKDLIKSEIEASKVIISHPRFRLASVVRLLVPLLKFIADKFSGAAIGELAKTLISLVLGLR
jgi:hypothetical protein